MESAHGNAVRVCLCELSMMKKEDEIKRTRCRSQMIVISETLRSIIEFQSWYTQSSVCFNITYIPLSASMKIVCLFYNPCLKELNKKRGTKTHLLLQRHFVHKLSCSILWTHSHHRYYDNRHRNEYLHFY